MTGWHGAWAWALTFVLQAAVHLLAYVCMEVLSDALLPEEPDSVALLHVLLILTGAQGAADVCQPQVCAAPAPAAVCH